MAHGRRASGMPAQNLVVGDSSGRIAWRCSARCRSATASCDARRCSRTSTAGRGRLDQPRRAAMARIGGRAAVVGPPTPAACGPPTAAWSMATLLAADRRRRLRAGARARQIRDDLFAKPQFTERDLLAIQLDDRALFLQRWWQLAARRRRSAREDAGAGGTGRGCRRRGRAAPAPTRSVIASCAPGGWRCTSASLDGLTAPARAALGEDFVMPDLPQLEGVVWPLVTQRPPHLLPRALRDLGRAVGGRRARGARRARSEQGPLARAHLGRAQHRRDLPSAGARAARCSASGCCACRSNRSPATATCRACRGRSSARRERMVVSPGHEADGIIHMPGGQSGHPLSPFWGAGHDDWVHGRPTPFLPGQRAEHTLRLRAVVSDRQRRDLRPRLEAAHVSNVARSAPGTGPAALPGRRPRRARRPCGCWR